MYECCKGEYCNIHNSYDCFNGNNWFKLWQFAHVLDDILWDLKARFIGA